MTPTAPQRILICGHRSFAAKELGPLLTRYGHQVTNFTRGRIGREGDTVRGPVEKMHENPHLAGPFDTVINYIILKDDDIAANERHMDSLLKFCSGTGVKHLIHLSSVSVYSAAAKVVTEDAPAETDPSRKGSYGALKVAQDNWLRNHHPDGLKITYFRPGFIFGPGMLDPIIGMGARLPGNQVLCLGGAGNRVSAITRELVDEALARTVAKPPEGKSQVVLVVDPNGPARKDYLTECCKRLGIGTHVVSLPKWFWLTAAAGGEVMIKFTGMKVSPWKVISNACREQRFDPRATEQRLDMKFNADWKTALTNSMDEQVPNFVWPYRPVEPETTRARRVNIIGYGGIIKQKHLPALKKLNFEGTIEAYDVKAGKDPNGQEIKAIEGSTLGAADLHIVASPGRFHNAAIPLLRPAQGAILVEKPLCYTEGELDEWLAFDTERRMQNKGGVFILHNSRFKPNVLAFMRHLQTYNPGRLISVDINYQSPSVGKHSPAWRRDERGSQTLLLDYSLHWLDLAMMFTRDAWTVKDLRWTMNKQGQTDLIEGRITSPQYAVNLCLRQGFIPKRCRVMFTFENYLCSLGFFPDTFVPHMSFDSWSLYKKESKANFRATFGKVVDKLTKKDSDNSHAVAMMGALGDPRVSECMTIGAMQNIYRGLFVLSKAVYG